MHRDVKPANIILTPDRGPVLVDFGLGLDEAISAAARLAWSRARRPTWRRSRSPGVAHRIDGRTDIYSLGVVLYQMLCGRLPFRASDIRELLRQVRDDEPQPPRQIARDVPPELERACLKALAKKLQDRYTTAADFAEDLRSVIPAPPDRLPAVRHWTISAELRPSESPTGPASAQRARAFDVIIPALPAKPSAGR